MENEFASLLAIVGVVLATSAIKMPQWSAKTKTTVATVLSVVAASVQSWQAGMLDPSDIVGSALIVFGGAQLLYRFLLDGSALDDKLESFGADDEA